MLTRLAEPRRIGDAGARAVLLGVLLFVGFEVYRSEVSLSYVPVGAAADASKAADRLRFAFCISGQLRALANEAFEDKFFKAFFEPLRPAHIDTFFHLDDTVDARNETVRSRLINRFKPVYYEIMAPSCQGKWSKSGNWCERKECTKRHYKNLGRYGLCMDAIKMNEKYLGMKYNFVIQVRPDLLFEKSLPQLSCWHNIRKDIIWDTLVFFENKRAVIDVSKRILLGKDTFKILPREMAEAFMYYFMHKYQSCEVQEAAELVQPECFTELLKKRSKAMGTWESAECFVTRAYLEMNATVGELHSVHKSHIVRCSTDVPFKHDQGRCLDVYLAPRRDSCYDMNNVNLHGSDCAFYNRSQWRPLPHVGISTECFPVQGYVNDMP